MGNMLCAGPPVSTQEIDIDCNNVFTHHTNEFNKSDNQQLRKDSLNKCQHLGSNLRKLSEASLAQSFNQLRSIKLEIPHNCKNSSLDINEDLTKRIKYDKDFLQNFEDLKCQSSKRAISRVTKAPTILKKLEDQKISCKNLNISFNNDSSNTLGETSILNNWNKFDREIKQDSVISSTRNSFTKSLNEKGCPKSVDSRFNILKLSSSTVKDCMNKVNQKFVDIKTLSSSRNLLTKGLSRRQSHLITLQDCKLDSSLSINDWSKTQKRNKLNNWQNKPTIEGENFQSIKSFERNSNIRIQVIRKLLKIPCLTAIVDQTIIEEIYNHSKPFSIGQRKIIYSFGLKPKYIYLTIRGKVMVRYSEKDKYPIDFPTEYFGEVEILCNSSRMTEMIASSDCYFFCVEKFFVMEALSKCYFKNNIVFLQLAELSSPISKSTQRKSTQKSLSQSASHDNNKNFRLSDYDLFSHESNNNLSIKRRSESFCYIDFDLLQSNCFMYSILPDNTEKMAFLESLIPEVYDTGEILIHSGEKSCSLFILVKGSVCSYTCYKQLVRTYSKGDIFGFSDFLHPNFSNLEVVASILTTVYRVPYTYFKMHVRQYEDFIIKSVLYSYKYISEVCDMSQTFVDKLVFLEQGSSIDVDYIEESKLYFIIDGSFENQNLNRAIKQLSRYKNQFDLSMLNNTNVTDSLTAETNLLIVQVDEVNLSQKYKFIDNEIENSSNSVLQLLSENHCFSFLSENFMIELSKSFNYKTFSEGTILYSSTPEQIYLVIEGGLSITKSSANSSFYPASKNDSIKKKKNRATSEETSKFRSFNDKACSGNSLLDIRRGKSGAFSRDSINFIMVSHENKGKLIGMNSLVLGNREMVKCTTNLKCYSISVTDFHFFFPKTRFIWNYFINNFLIQDEICRFSLAESFVIEESNSINRMLSIENRGFLYHLKCFSEKDHKPEADVYKTLATFYEQGLVSPFNLQVLKYFEMSDSKYFVINYSKSIRLSSFLSSGVQAEESAIAFWSLNICLAIQWLHDIKIVHGDIKPESFCMNIKGYLSISDYSCAYSIQKDSINSYTVGDDCLIAKKKSALKGNLWNYESYEQRHSNREKSRTIVGTPHYMSPEIIQNKVANCYHIDFWSMGVTIYELAFGIFPFSQSHDDPYDIYIKILRGELKFPDKRAKDIELVKDLISKLLKRDLETRLTRVNLILDHPLFKDIENVANLKQKASYIPNIEYEKLRKGNMLLNYFDLNPQNSSAGK